MSTNLLLRLCAFLASSPHCYAAPPKGSRGVPRGLEAHPRPSTLTEAGMLHALAARSARQVRTGGGYASSEMATSLTSHVGHRGFSGSPSSGVLVMPTDFGADATGQADATSAFQAALAACMNSSATRAAVPMATGIRNLGGLTLDLTGGTYLISRPLVFPDFNGDYRISGGMLRASSSFPSERFLIEIGTESCQPKDGQGVCSEFVTLENLFLDGSHSAAGCIRVDKTMGTMVGPSAFCTGFKDAGVRINGGHETMVANSWFASYYWDAKPPASVELASAAIEINGEDNYITDVIVFGAQKQGALINGGVNVLSNVHSWGGPLVINGSWTLDNRLLNCYVDYGYIEIVNPASTLVKDTFFLNAHLILSGSRIQGVTVRDNIYTSNSQWGHPGNSNIELAGNFQQGDRCDNVVIEEEIADPWKGLDWNLRSTRARLVMHKENSTVWTFDFSSLLVFSWIDEVTYSVTYDIGAPMVVNGALPSHATEVSVSFAAETSATVIMDVVQCPLRHRTAARTVAPVVSLSRLNLIGDSSATSSEFFV